MRASVRQEFGAAPHSSSHRLSRHAEQLGAGEFKTLFRDLHPDALSSSSTDAQLRARISQIKALSTTGGMEEEEYLHVMRYMRSNAPQRLLIWGLGYDSVTYEQLNTGGVTVFLEFDISWVGKADAATRQLHFAGYDDKAFGTSVERVHEFIAQPHRADEIGVLADRPCFDTVIVDSPLGLLPQNTGRAVPIYTAAADLGRCLSKGMYPSTQNVSVFVHDCNRKSEQLLTDAFLGKPVLELGPKKLREYRLRGGGGERRGGSGGARDDDL